MEAPDEEKHYTSLKLAAKSRWLEPDEVSFIIKNHLKYDKQETAAPDKPNSGSFFLYNKKDVPHFRKDGWKWRKECHADLKENIKVYYAHGKDTNSNLQRRSYWIAEKGEGLPITTNAVMVHYRDVREGTSGSRAPASQSPTSLVSHPQRILLDIEALSPDWGYSMENTWVYVSGSFFCDGLANSWHSLFGTTTVPAMYVAHFLLSDAPPLPAGKVDFCVMVDGEQCSRSVEFEYRVNPRCLEQLPHIERLRSLACDPSQVAAMNRLRESILAGLVNGPQIHEVVSLHRLAESACQWVESKYQAWLNMDATSRLYCPLSISEQETIHAAAAFGHEGILGLLLQMRVNVNLCNYRGATPLHLAAREGKEDMVVTLIYAGASEAALDNLGQTPASYALQGGYTGVAAWLSELYLSVTYLDSLGEDATFCGEVLKESSNLFRDSAADQYAILTAVAVKFANIVGTYLRQRGGGGNQIEEAVSRVETLTGDRDAIAQYASILKKFKERRLKHN